ncbi:hypothetical protein BJ508DRAFT_33636 [Ascobolus immersus RN42]|uniref:Uncharacterized protein n=1 Tax=Ascobolus immersus RN42 TaxID=1160509 RepID=A0A3N4HLD0_ASCIM|nr:hypothetical protein BJ508DRAFT_33636 [Ascobolus immersus RN42]
MGNGWRELGCLGLIWVVYINTVLFVQLICHVLVYQVRPSIDCMISYAIKSIHSMIS